MGRRRDEAERTAVLECLAAGRTHRETSAVTGVPVETIRTWLKRQAPQQGPRCARCRQPLHDFAALPPSDYSYLLGSYLGDGCIWHARRTHYLRITLDTAYPAVIAEVAAAMAAVRERPPRTAPDARGKNCVDLISSWVSWPCLFPQHGPGRKHTRPITLEPWQQTLVDAAPGMFLRGLIHTDGWRGVNRVTAKGKAYAYPRYQFSNRSDDIRRLFCDTCDQLGIEWRRWGRWHISVAKRESVARLDAFVGPKS